MPSNAPAIKREATAAMRAEIVLVGPSGIERQIKASPELCTKAAKLTAVSGVGARQSGKSLLRPFGSVNTVGESFTVYKVAGLDVSLPRRESKTGRGHKGFTVTGDPTLSIEEAARRLA